MNYQKPILLDLKSHPVLNEQWVQDRIAEDPSLLSLGDVILKDRERRQPRAGRLDLLLQETDSTRRFEVEIQLGKTDESHIIRTLEYWDIERKRYPQYDHTAVIVAEQITSRFLNVISLFNGTIPIIAIQMQAIQLGETVSLIFTNVLDAIQRGLVDEDEEVQEITDRNYWESRGSKSTVAICDELLSFVKPFDQSLELKYNKFYIGLARNGVASNFVIFKPQKNAIRIEVRLPKSVECSQQLEDAGIDVMDYDARWGRYRLRLQKNDISKYQDLLKGLFQQAYEMVNGSDE